jgi:hypothetical protein
MTDEEAYQLLEVQRGASAEEVRTAYRELAKVWHPDRFSSDPRLQARAAERMKAINRAYDHLRDRTARSTPPGEPTSARPPRPPSPPSPPAPEAPRSERTPPPRTDGSLRFYGAIYVTTIAYLMAFVFLLDLLTDWQTSLDKTAQNLLGLTTPLIVAGGVYVWWITYRWLKHRL